MIRFQCAACRQPLEIDPEWAGKVVACPYCRRTMTAPTESTLGNLQEVPMATPAASHAPPASLPGALPTYDDYASPVPVVIERKNTWAVAALVLAGCVLVTLMVAGSIKSAHRLELEEFLKEYQAAAEEVGFMQASFKVHGQRGGMPPTWLLTLSALQIGGLMLNLAGIVLGGIALARPTQRGLAMAALLGCIIMLPLVCMMGI